MRKFVEELGIGRAVGQTSPAAITDDLRELYENRSAYRMTEDATRRLAEEYSWPVQVEKLIALYRSLLPSLFSVPVRND